VKRTSEADHRIGILGAGFSGIGMAIRLRQAGIEDFVVLERSDDVGGTWNDNTYPGCQCDIPSHLYSFSFALNPEWTRTYPLQQEIWAYLRRCVERFGVRDHIRLGTELTGADWDEEAGLWRLETSRGPLSVEVLVAAPGALSQPSLPAIAGLESFRGRSFHSAQWDHDHDLTGRRVAVVGTGASAIQVVPRIQPLAESVEVFQRTPPWVMPHRDRPISRIERRIYRRFPQLQRLVRAWVYWSRELLVPGFVHYPGLLKGPERMARRHLEKQVPDPELRARLTPTYRIGCKRIVPSNEWYPALTKPNVQVVTEPIRELSPNGIVTADGTEHELDTVVFATGFQVTDIPLARLVRGRDGLLLSELWDGSPQAYMGASVAGFPNFMLLVGPNTGLGHNSLVFMIEAQIAYVLGALRAMEERAATRLEVKAEAQRAFNAKLQRRMQGTVWKTGGCASWYLDAHGKNTTLWPGSTWRFWQRARRFDPQSYRFSAPAGVAAGESPRHPAPELV
jgi:cation diffusion facilitator CzcD-associated flavoprotein CzcO